MATLITPLPSAIMLSPSPNLTSATAVRSSVNTAEFLFYSNNPESVNYSIPKPSFIVRMKKLFVRISLIAIMVFSVFSMPSNALQHIQVYFLNSEVPFSETDGFGTPFTDNNNIVQVPVRKLMEALGATVDYNAFDRVVSVELDGNTLLFEVGRKTWLNGELYEIDASTTLIDGRAYIPVQYVVEPFGYTAIWDSVKSSVWVRQTAEERWMSPTQAFSPLSILNGSIGLIFWGPYGEMSISGYEILEFDRLHISIYNTADFDSGEDIILDPIDFEYRLFRVTNEGDELLFSKTFPQFSGVLPAGTFTYCSIEIPYWRREILIPGDYKIQLSFPEYFVYRHTDSSAINHLPVRPNMFFEYNEFRISP
jgi:hypothetical protein